MDERTTFRVQEFARLAGVTVRTLHVYDEAGLLSPSARTASGHRRYRRVDLLRLQQILTLKYLGFSLEEIRALLEAPAYDLRESLRIQKDAVEQRILGLQGVAYALARTLDALEAEQEVEWAQVIAIIRGLREADKSDWQRRYFPPEEWAWLQERAAHMTPELVRQGTEAWSELYAAFRAHAHLPPEHPDVQRLAERMHRLIAMFTAGRPEAERGLAALYEDPASLPRSYRPEGDAALERFMRSALELYRRRHEMAPSPSQDAAGEQHEQ
jgi:MerR family transcriptional regulator, thiopeptide resistance regulator